MKFFDRFLAHLFDNKYVSELKKPEEKSEEAKRPPLATLFPPNGIPQPGHLFLMNDPYTGEAVMHCGDGEHLPEDCPIIPQMSSYTPNQRKVELADEMYWWIRGFLDEVRVFERQPKAADEGTWHGMVKQAKYIINRIDGLVPMHEEEKDKPDVVGEGATSSDGKSVS